MIPAVQVSLIILLQLLLWDTAVPSPKVELRPKKPLFRVGDRQEITCRTSQCQSEKISFGWQSVQDKPLDAATSSSSTESTLIFNNVSKIHEDEILCKVSCNDKKFMKFEGAVQIRVYSFPKHPIISGHEGLVLGKETTLSCNVYDVYPAERMTVEWLRGGEVVDTKEGAYGTESIQSHYTFIPQITDNNSSITCRATLAINDLPEEEKTRETTVSMSVFCPLVRPLISVYPDNAKEKEVMNISCISASNKTSSLVLSKILDGKEKELVSGDGPRVSVFYHEANLSHSGVYVCKSTNACGKETYNATVTVGTHTLEVSLQPNRNIIPVKYGSLMKLSCNTSGCPYTHITWKNVAHQPRQNWNDTHAFTSRLGPWTIGLEDNRTFICQAECGSVVKSSHTKLKVFAFSSDPTIETSGPFLEGNVTNLTCTVREIFPANHFRMQWLDGGHELQSVDGYFSNKLQNLSLTLPFKPKDRDQNRTFTCKVSLQMEGISEEKTVSTTLAVHYSPKNTTIDVKPQKKLNEGNNITISCQTNSSPEGKVTLRRVQNGEETQLASSNGIQTTFTIPFSKASHTGIYVCEAVNKYGRQRESIQVIVEAPPRNITVNVYPSVEVQEGENITICCQSESFPPSEITLRKLDNKKDIYSSNGTFLLVNLTSTDSGLYQVNASNPLGSKTEIFAINVLTKSSHDGVLSMLKSNSLYCIIPGVVAAVGISLVVLKKLKKNGLYDLTEGIP